MSWGHCLCVEGGVCLCVDSGFQLHDAAEMLTWAEKKAVFDVHILMRIQKAKTLIVPPDPETLKCSSTLTVKTVIAA